MYFLRTNSEGFGLVQSLEFKELSEGLSYYHATIQYMMLKLPNDQWFDLKLFRHRTPDDPVDNKGKSTKSIIVRSWVY